MTSSPRCGGSWGVACALSTRSWWSTTTPATTRGQGRGPRRGPGGRRRRGAGRRRRRPRQGEALWRSLYASIGDIVIWCDADITDFGTRFVSGLLGPLITDPDVAFVKGYYERPRTGSLGGGRTTELTAAGAGDPVPAAVDDRAAVVG